MSRPEIVRFNHTSFTVADLDASLRFFVEVLGFSLRDRSRRDPRLIGTVTGLGDADVEIAYLDGYGHTLELIEYRTPADRTAARYRPCDAGAAHIALDVTAFDRMLAEVEAHGFRRMGEVIVVPAGPNKGRRAVYTRSQDGIILELIEAPR
ncbi:MAG: VOC family protein [Geminicoccaceae bacterium]|nr:VOC family protein [Geminicoccaceae bacterium]